MTWLRFARSHHLLLSGAALAAAGSIALTASALVQPAAAGGQPIERGQAAALIQATAGAGAAKVQAIGEDARLINAAMPFSEVPVQPARAFVLPAGGTLDQRRALLCLTQAVYYEAGFEPAAGRRAVAQVILNRLRHPAFPKSVCGVVYQHNSTPICQFTFVCDGSLNRRPAAAAWKQSEDVARAALDGYVERSVGAATHYHADYVAPYWAPMLTKISKLGAHIFYRWPGAWGQPSAFNGRYIGEPRDPSSLRAPVILASLSVDGGEEMAAVGPITDGTVLKRAPNDVGGLLDTSKGWTLNIPMPNETDSAARRVAQSQSAAPPAATQNDAGIETRVIASR